MLIRLIALLEWFSTLAIQMIALRMAIPVVGSSVVLTSIYIWVILLALSAGYRIGWNIAERYKHSRRHLWMILAWYLTLAGVYYSLITFGMHIQLLEYFLQSTDSYLVTLFLVSTILFAFPVLLASQTIPLLTELLPVQSKGHAAGQILFASTIGSFLWSVLTSIVLFPTLGVAMTWAITVSLLLLAWVLSMKLRNSKWFGWSMWLRVLLSAGLVFSVQAVSNSETLYQWDTMYHEIEIRNHIYQWEQMRLMVTNGGFSSAWDLKKWQSPFPYLRTLVQETKKLQPPRVLLIWTAGFTYPAELQNESRLERIDAIDIDGEFLELSQKYLLEQKLNDKVVFHSDSARYFLRQAIAKWEQYDLVVLDAYNGRFVPAELATVDFFHDVKQVCGDECMVLSNLIMDYDMESDFSKGIIGAMQSVWSNLWMQKLHSGWQSLGNSIIATYEFEWSEEINNIALRALPTDNKNNLEKDLVDMWWK